MTSKERVLSTLHFTNTEERIPRQLWSLPCAQEHCPEMMERLAQDFEWDFDGPDTVWKEYPATKGDAYAVGEYVDEWGSQNDLLISPQLWDEFFAPMYRDYIEIAHRNGKKIFMHSDGNILRIIPKLIDLGLDAVNSQLFCMGLENLAPDKGKITFWGEIDRQHLLPKGTTADIDQAVESVYITLWQNGGCIAQCEFGPGANPENVYRVYQAWEKIRKNKPINQKASMPGGKDMSILSEISENLQRGKAKIVKELVQQAIDEGVPARDILEQGLLAGMDVVGDKFKKNEVFVPEVLVAARAMNMGTTLLKPLLAESGVEAAGKVCIGTVKGDLHDIGKNLVKMMMEGKGLEVVDLGTDVAPETYVQTAVEQGCQIICCSALLTTTMPVMGEVVKEAEKAGIRDKVKIMIGGAPVTEAFCLQIGADKYTTDAASAADAAVAFCHGMA